MSVRHVSNTCKDPIDFFNLMYTPRLWYMIVENTNKYGNSIPLRNWKNVIVKDMKGFMAIVFNMAIDN